MVTQERKKIEKENEDKHRYRKQREKKMIMRISLWIILIHGFLTITNTYSIQYQRKEKERCIIKRYKFFPKKKNKTSEEVTIGSEMSKNKKDALS